LSVGCVLSVDFHSFPTRRSSDLVVVSKQAGAPESFLLDLINHGVLDLLINTPVHYGPAWEEGRWRAAATARRLPLITTLAGARRSEEHTSELQSRENLVCRLLLE